MFPVALVVSVIALALGLINASFGDPTGAVAPAQINATVATTAYGDPVPAGFLGLSLEYWAIENYAGTNPAAIDPLFERLVRNLAPGQAPVLRIGGDSADWSWWPVPGMARPPGVTATLDNRLLAVTDALGKALGAHLILGLNLEADSSGVASAEARAMLSGIGPGLISAFELGNEPAQYGSFAWYRTTGGHVVTGRPKGYDFGAFLSDFTRVASALPSYALAGPTTGGPGWMGDLGRFLTAEPRVRLVTVHHYPLQLCRTPRSSARYPTIANVLAPTASTGLAAGFAEAVKAAHAHGLPLRIDELNTVSCGGDPAVSQTFASALWALDALFELKRTGVDGVQMHTFPGAGYALFALHKTSGQWTASISPEYYGLLMFAAAAPAGSRLLTVAAPADGTLKIWATVGRDGRVRVVLINKETSRARTVRLAVPGARGPASLERLTAPSVNARAGVSLGGQTFGAQSRTAVLSAPRMTIVTAGGGRYAVRVPAGSAALLTVSGR